MNTEENLRTDANANFIIKVEVDANKGRSPEANDKKRKRGDGFVAVPVSFGASGKGLPYAPENYPLIGDVWSWRVGNRLTDDGYFRDRFLYPPSRYAKSEFLTSKGLRSRVLVEKFVLKEIQTVSPETFFASFLWKIPSNKVTSYKG